jgi:hypothetical protein
MTRILILSFLTLLLWGGNPCYGQLTEHRFHLSGRVTTGLDDTVTFQNYSASFEWHVHRNIGLIYSLDWMQRTDAYRIIHTPAGIIGAPLLLIFSGGYIGSGWLLFCVLAMPDGIALHLPFRYKWDFSPYVNVAGLDFVTDKNTGITTIEYATSFGFKTTYLLNDQFVITALAESRYTFGNNLTIGGGLGLGYAFGKRKNPNERRGPFQI